jgi:hypothetical protein
LVLLSLCLAAGPAAAQPAGSAPPPDAVPADTTAGAFRVSGEAKPRLPMDGPREPQPKPPPFSNPFWVMMRSAVVPGWGQAYNHSWLKAAGVATAEVYLISQIVEDTRDLDRLSAEIDAARADNDADAEVAAVDAYNARLEERTATSWWLAGAAAYALLDAYVDAHFRGFAAEFAMRPTAPGRAPEPRLALRWSF